MRPRFTLRLPWTKSRAKAVLTGAEYLALQERHWRNQRQQEMIWSLYGKLLTKALTTSYVFPGKVIYFTIEEDPIPSEILEGTYPYAWRTDILNGLPE